MYNHKLLYYLSLILLIIACNIKVQAQSFSKASSKKQYKSKKVLSKKSTPSRKARVATNRKATINLNNLNHALLENLIEEKINQERRKKSRKGLESNTTLKKMAIDQNRYMLRKGKIGHKQSSPKKRTLMDRLKFYNGKMAMVGENVLYKSINIHTNKLPSYEVLAKKIVKLWVDSDGHYANLINKKFRLMGTKVGYDAKKKRVYATQVFGKPF